MQNSEINLLLPAKASIVNWEQQAMNSCIKQGIFDKITSLSCSSVGGNFSLER